MNPAYLSVQTTLIKLDQVSQIIPIKLKLNQITSITHFELLNFPYSKNGWSPELRAPGLHGSVVWGEEEQLLVQI